MHAARFPIAQTGTARAEGWQRKERRFLVDQQKHCPGREVPARTVRTQGDGDSRNGGRKWAVREASRLEVWSMETGTGRETVLQDMETGRCGRTDQRAGSRVLTGKTRDRIRV